MGALEQFESFLRDLLERPGWFLSRHNLEPLEVASALTRELEARVRRDGTRILIPTNYLVILAQGDLAHFGPSLHELEQEMTAYVQHLAIERALTLQTAPSVRIRAGPDLTSGQLRVIGSFGATPELVCSMPLRADASGPASSATLALLGHDDCEIERFALKKRSVTLGRRSDNDIALDDTKLSRHHARLEFDNGTYYLTNLASTNGTRVNGESIGGRHALEPADVIEVGLHRFRFSR